MMTNCSTKLLAASVLAFAAAISLHAATLPFLHPLFTDNMVLQRDRTDKVWGWTTPGVSVTVVINSQTNSTTAGADGRWQVAVGPFPVGGPYTLTVTGPQSATYTNVMMGDVILCSGQSNMERQLGPRPPQPDILNYQAEAAAATNSNIRHFLVPQTSSPQVQQTISGGNWVVCSPSTVTNFTAVGYETAKYITSVTNVPIGILHSSLGGTRIESWLDPKTALQLADFAPTVFDLAGQTNTYTGAVGTIPATELYNAMIAPLTNYSVRAVLWYQGENNYDKPSQYSGLLPAFMNGWRACFGQPNLPFIACQLANYSTAQTLPVETGSYAELREAQLNTVRADANSRLATLIDLGRTNSASTATVDIHQPDKEQVGQRCAWAALNLVYGQDIYNQGPFFSGATVSGTNILCTFTNVGAGLTAGWFVQLSPVVPTNGALTGFAIAGADKTFYSASAVIVSNDTIAVSSPSVPSPVYVRYAWGYNPAANLYGKMTNAVGAVVDGLPASSFRNDPVYGLSVNNGTGGNLNLSPGATASISASAAPASESFGFWTGDTAQLSATNATSCTATMNKPYVAVLANYAITNAPASVQAVPGDGQVRLSWGALSGTHYEVKRATSVGGPFSVINSNVNATALVDTTVTNGVTYYYQVAGTNLIGEGPFSAALAATPNANIPPPLISRYSFSETSGTNAADSVSGYTGTLKGSAAFNGSGKVVLNGSSSTYVSLPPAQLSGFGAVTFEAWFTFSIVNNNVHLFSIDNGNGTGSGGSYLRYNLYDTGNGHGATNFFENAVSYAGNSLLGGMVLPQNVTNHVVLVYDPVKGVKAIYINGALKASYTGSLTALSSIPQTIFALGRSPWANSDPYLNGSIDEFRVYGGAMNSNQVAAADVLGPNQLLATSAPPQPTGLTATAGSGQVVLTWNASTNVTGYNLKRATVSGGPYSTVAANLAVTNFTDITVTNGIPYFYVVAGTNNFGESPISTEVAATPVPASTYTLPDLPPMPLVTPAAANSMPMGNPANFPEVKMDFAIETNGAFVPTWPSISANVPGNGTPAWLRQAKFGIWFHYGPQANLQSGDWSAQHMYQQGSTAYNNHLANFGYPATNGYKDVIKAWAPTNYSPAGMAQLFYNAGARFVLVQGVHHDNFDNWNSRYNPWNMVNFGAKRDTMAEWTNAIHNLGMHMGVAFHHEYSWWFTQPDFLSDSTGTFAGVPYDAVTATNSVGTWWQNYDVRRLYNQDIHKYQGISTPTTSYWNPTSGIFTNDLDYCHWYATQWALRMLDVVEAYNPDFIYTDGNSTQPFSGYATSTGYKCDAMQRVIAHYYNRTLQRHGQLDTLAVVKFHNGDHIGTTFEGGYSTTIKQDQPWFAEFGIGDWFWKPGISYDNGGAIVYRLLEAISRDGAMMVNIPNRPDGALDSGATNMLQGVGQWMAIHGEGIYGSRAWVTPTDGSFRFTVGTNGLLYAFYEGIPSGGTILTIPSLASTSGNLKAAIASVSLLGSASALSWSQTSTGLVVTLPATMPSLPSGTAIGLKIGPATAVGSAPPASVIALPGTNQISLSWYCPSATATYNVKRSLTHGGSYTPIATNLTAMAFTDTNAAPGVLYFYVVTATDAAGESVNSAEASASLAAVPSTNWLTEDVGAVGATGSFGLTNGVFTIQGSGADIWNSADEFRYVFQAISGDISITTRVTNMQNTAGWAKAGVMFRETLDPSSKYVINYLSPANGVALQQRDTTGGSASGVANLTGLAAPYWVRLMRVGNNFSAYCSPDGTNWTLVGSTTVAMNSIAYVGLEVCSHVDGTLNTSLFDNVSLAAPQFPGTPASLNAAGGNGLVGLNWSAAANASTYNLKRATTSGGSYTTVFSSLTGTTYFDTSAVNGATYYYVISGVNALGESANSLEVSATPTTLSLSSPWNQADVGVTTPAGNGGNSGGTFFNQGSGADIWGTADAFHFIYLRLTNDCSMTARVLNMQNPATTSKAGVMIRDQLNANCVHALVDVTPGVGVEFIRRITTNGATTAAATTGITAPQWIRVTRVGSTFSAYRSPDGVAWSMVGSSVSIPTMSAGAYVGLIVNSHSSGTLCLAQFDNVSWTPSATPSTPAWLSATVGGNQAVLTWASSDNATGYNLKRSTTNGGPYLTIATNAPGYSFTDAGLVNGTAYYYVVTATNTTGESATSPQTVVWPVSTAPLTFNCGMVGNQLQLSWPADHTGWRLQMNTNLSTVNWQDVSEANATNQISIQPTNGNAFFRLVYP